MFKATVRNDGEKIKKVKGDNVIIVSIEPFDDNTVEVDGVIAGDPEIIMNGLTAIVKNVVNTIL